MIANFLLLQSGQAQSGGSGLVNILMIVALVVVFYLMMIRPQQKRQKEIRKFRESLGKGSKVLTAGGIHGTIISFNEKSKSYKIEIANGVNITVEQSSVYPLSTPAQDIASDKGGENIQK